MKPIITLIQQNSALSRAFCAVFLCFPRHAAVDPARPEALALLRARNHPQQSTPL